MTDKNKLIDLIDKAKKEYESIITDYTETDYIVERLINEGIILPPCKMKTEIFVIPSKTNYELNKINGFEENNRIYRQIVKEVRIYESGKYMLITCDGLQAVHCDFFGHTWFLNKEEAEAELRKRGE